MMAEQNMQEFIEVLSSKAAVPGGGGACAYVAAAGMALGAMVANLTTGKKKYAQYQEEIEELLSKAEQLSKELMTYMDKEMPDDFQTSDRFFPVQMLLNQHFCLNKQLHADFPWIHRSLRSLFRLR